MATAERLSGDLCAAERNFREALRIARAVDYQEGVAYITGNLASVALDRHDWSSAETLAREALRLTETIHRQEMIAEDCRRLSTALVRQGKTAEARPYAQRAVDTFTRFNSPLLAKAQAILAECDASLGTE
ncbi:MAG TPA: tetratricopeptide repeat protein [Prosthecobacter sp.]|nr:tetratricopeptide repeat protein [Prosthecobacter sp.]